MLLTRWGEKSRDSVEILTGKESIAGRQWNDTEAEEDKGSDSGEIGL